jgi:hypothetical protein
MYNNPTRLLVLRKTEIRQKRGNGVKKAEKVYIALTTPLKRQTNELAKEC